MVLQYRQKNTARPTGDRTGRLCLEATQTNPATNNAQETNRVNAYINITLILHQDAGQGPGRRVRVRPRFVPRPRRPVSNTGQSSANRVECHLNPN